MSDPTPSLFARIRATGRLWNSLLLLIDAVIVTVATLLAYEVRFEGLITAEFAPWVPRLIVLSIVVYGLLFAIFDLYRLVLRYVSLDALLRLLGASAMGFTLLTGLDIAIGFRRGLRPVPIGVLFMQAALIFIGVSAARLSGRLLLYARSRRQPSGRRVLIIGAGSGGSLLLQEIIGRPDLEMYVVGLLDDDPALRGRILKGVPVLGATDELAALVEERQIDEVIVAIPGAAKEDVRRILNVAADAGVQTRVIPPLVIEKGSVSLRDLRPVEVEDLLGREPTPIDVTQVKSTLTGKVVAVTGAAGSIGSELCRQIMKMQPRQLLLIEIDETRLYELWLELRLIDERVPEMCMCDIRDAAKIDAVIEQYRPEVLLHAAAYKHVPLMELAPEEAIKTNVMGTRNVIEACERHGVRRFVLISTDKAVAPANVMGLTKLLAEREMLATARRGKLSAVAVRFGNVLASRGSVVPIFEQQLRHGGPLTVTHREVTRYFMTIPEASRLVLQAQAIGKSGDIFVLEMGDPVRIVDLARKMIALSGVPADIEFVGLRPGEKLHEALTGAEESLLTTERPNILRVDRVPVTDTHDTDEIDRLIELAEQRKTAEMFESIERLDPGFVERDRPSAS